MSRMLLASRPAALSLTHRRSHLSFSSSSSSSSSSALAAFPAILRRRSPLSLSSNSGPALADWWRWGFRRPPHCRRRLVSRAVAFAGADGAMLQDAGATAVVMAGAYALVSLFNSLTNHKLIERRLSRKLVHILSGLLYMASWPIFSTSMEARYFASIVPLVNGLRLVINGLTLTPDQELIESVTRDGSPGELLKGPLYYVLILIACSLFFWRESPVAVMSLAMMCGGDGVADIMGRRFGATKIPYNKQKSLAGSFSMLACGFLISIGMLYYFSVLGYFQLDWAWTIRRVALVSLAATLVESLPITKVVDDNIAVPLATMVMASLSFR